MIHRLVALSGILFAVAALAAFPVRAADENARPNIVMFISDDHGYWDSPVYGNKVVQTPAMEQLAFEGVRFTQTFVGSPCCSPNRAVLHTGLHSSRNGHLPNHSRIDPEIKTTPMYFESLGYRTVLMGKTHLNPQNQYPFEYPENSVIHGGPLNADLNTETVEKVFAEHPKDQPLLAFVNSHSPHVYWPENDGYDPSQVDLPPKFIDTPETRDYRTQYYTDVTLMDKRLGEVYAAAKKHLGENTLFIYTSDHGAQWPFGKWTLYDTGIRVPMIAVWPGKLIPGKTSNAMISYVDFLPTFIELAGGEPPQGIDGQSFAALLRGERLSHRQEIFATNTGDGEMSIYPSRCVRTGDYKYILNLYPWYTYSTHIDKGINKDGLAFWQSWERAAARDPAASEIVDAYRHRPREELYLVRKDPFEQENLARDPKHAGALEELRGKLRDWMKAQGDKLSDDTSKWQRPRPGRQ